MKQINFSEEEINLLSNYSDIELIEFADTLNTYIIENFGMFDKAGKIARDFGRTILGTNGTSAAAKRATRNARIAFGVGTGGAYVLS